MQLSLDPKELGNVEVTLISRGNHLHIQVTSNPTAINMMATQGQELRNQLVSMGFTDVQMQFNMNQQQQRQHGKQPQNSHYYGEEEIPDLYESLDIIIPQYV
jgi:flagellar hook-length control protein FliK